MNYTVTNNLAGKQNRSIWVLKVFRVLKCNEKILLEIGYNKYEFVSLNLFDILTVIKSETPYLVR